MYLRTLTLRGFKSFASATTLNFEPGVTCVVGPNGSGKSNVVDALAWVMGEQGAKSLRGGKMEDVIFAGTSGRAPLGRAEVSLTIDNSDGALPIDYTEVTISRTLFRSGGSEYAINGQVCRLLDIQELLSDSGMGREMHVIVGQGQLDSVLRATPEERRGFIEEAAGILKHRRRKEKALRKLEAMSANLTRLGDLTAEIRRQLGPLGRQAEVARRASVVQIDIRDAKARLLADEAAQLQAQLEQDTVDESALKTRIAEVEKELADNREQLAQLELASSAASGELRAANDTFYRLQALRDRVSGTATLAGERLLLLGSDDGDDERLNVGDPGAQYAIQGAKLKTEADELEAEIARLHQQVTDAQTDRAAKEEQLKAIEGQAAALQRAITDRRDGLANAVTRVAAARSRVESRESEIGRLTESLITAKERAAAAREQFAALEVQVTGVELGEEDLDRAHEAAAEKFEAAQAELARLEEELAEITSNRRALEARVETLELSLVRKDGAGALLGAELTGLGKPLGEQLKIKEGYADAVAGALGDLADSLTAQSAEAAAAGLTWLRDQDAGRAKVLIADPQFGKTADTPAANAKLPAGAVAATDVVTAPVELRGLILVLLGDVVVVPEITDALRLVAAHPSLRAVTKTGDLLSSQIVAGGSAAQHGTVHLQAALDSAQAELAQQVTSSEQLRFAISGARVKVAETQEAHQDTLAKLHESDAALAAVAEQLGSLSSQIRAADGEAERLAQSLERAEVTLDADQQQLAELTERLEAARSAPEDDERRLVDLADQRTELTDQVSVSRHKETELRLAQRTAEERFGALTGRIRSLEAAARREREAAQRAAEAAARRKQAATVARQVQGEAQIVLTQLQRSVEAARTARDQLEVANSDRETALRNLRTAVDTLRAEYDKLTDVAHREEVARAQQRLRMEQYGERALAEQGLSVAELIEQFGPHLFVPQLAPESGEEPGEPIPYVREQQEKRLRKAERMLSQLGSVNPLALEEFAALTERYDFLTEQLGDLKKSRADLLDIVKDIDDRMEQVFAEAFADTAAEFERVFPRLFPGGEGRLLLTDPENMLTTGVEVEARPAGKKVKRLSLLSGGERSLTAVALLVAIFLARPSPFYVMDEVEAALDDTNLGRLLEIFKDLKKDSQLIVVTHQKRTMEIADALYGVTMRGDGVTTVISQRLSHDDED